MKISRRQFLKSACWVTAGAIGADGLFIEPERVTVTRHDMGSRTDGGQVVLRVAHLSDLHLKGIGSHERRIASFLSELRPDLVLLTGDIIDRKDRLPLLAPFLDLLDRKTTKFAVLGNREYYPGLDVGGMRKVYESRNTQLLINESALYSHHGRPVLITGLDDATVGSPDIRGAMGGFSPQPNHILLEHSPAYCDRIPSEAGPLKFVRPGTSKDRTPDCYTVSCVLAGHTHGGQVAPFGMALILPAGSGRYVSGWYLDAPLPLYVSRGLGTTILPVRLGSPPEIAVFDWRLA
jgi:predicted MPP superfamily phosphohydrolase